MNRLVSPGTRPLLVTADDHVLDDLLRLAAAAGIEADVVADAAAARARWSAAPIVLVGDDRAESLLALGPPRRPGVLVVCAGPPVTATWQRAVGLGAEHVLELGTGEARLVECFADVADGGGPEQAIVVGVAGGRGGAGASVLASALAVCAVRRRLATMLVDADPFGGGLDLVLGAEHSGGLRWPDLADTRGRIGGSTLRDHLPDPHGLTVLSWDRGGMLNVPAEAVRAVVAAARRSWDLVVVDLPRRCDPATEEFAGQCHRLLLVVPAEVRAVAAAGRVAAGLGVVASDISVVVRKPAPSGLRSTDIAAALGLPVAAELDPEPGLAEALERGEPPAWSGRGPLATICERLLDEMVDRDDAEAA
ncbi:MAG TPA: septum site-determining protein Ssd [Jiangellaceae bacterium]|nr:septum site-determining protein Ssd [Jiangellaceae bacterium]